MDRSPGLVIPAYRPDVSRLAAYVDDLVETVAPAAIRIELDDPEPGVEDELSSLPATVAVARHRRGKGAAITHGFERLETDVLAFVDADGSIPAASVAEVIAPVRRREAGLAVGSRRHPESTVRAHQTHARRWLGDWFVRIARWLLEPQLTDYQCGAKAIDRDVWRDIRRYLYEPGFGWDIELIGVTAALGHAIVEVPVVWDDQPGSTVSTLGTTGALARTLLATRRRAKLLSAHPSRATVGPPIASNRPALVDRPGPNDD